MGTAGEMPGDAQEVGPARKSTTWIPRKDEMEDDQSFSRLVLVFAIAIAIVVGVILVSMLF